MKRDWKIQTAFSFFSLFAVSHTSSTSLLGLFLQKRNLCSGFELLVSYHPSLIFAQHWRTAKRRKEGLEGNFGLEFLLRCNCILASVWRIKTTVILSFFLLQFLEIYDLVLLWIKLYVLKQNALIQFFCIFATPISIAFLCSYFHVAC